MALKIERFQPPGMDVRMQEGKAAYSHVVTVSGTGKLIFIAGQLGRDELSTAVLYDVLVSGPILLLGAFAVGAAFGTKSGETPRDRVRAFFTRNPPLYGAVLGLLVLPDRAVPAFHIAVQRRLEHHHERTVETVARLLQRVL